MISRSLIMDKRLRFSDAERTKCVFVPEELAKKADIWTDMIKVAKDDDEPVYANVAIIAHCIAQIVLDESVEDLDLLVGWLFSQVAITNGNNT